MKRNLWIAAAVLWLAPLAVGLRYWQVWDQLPASMATHFNAAGHPNGWMTPSGSLAFMLGMLAFFAAIAVIVVAVIPRAGTAVWAILGLFYAIIGLLVWSNEQVLGYNLRGSPMHVAAIVWIALTAPALFLAIYLSAERGLKLKQDRVIAEEVHASAVWGLVLTVPVVLMITVAAATPDNNLRLALALSAIVLVFAAGMPWLGFHYRFTPAGVEIRLFGFRLRSIPLAQIQGYNVQNWSAWRGYGIRGLGNSRAYVWSNRVVRIRTNNGEVFLGHNHPERIVRDLDAITQFSH
jgi:hypothetical protein